MKGIDPQLCTHHIYTEKDARPIRQPQRRLNPHLKDIVKDELQKLLDVNFIYPISDSKWVSISGGTKKERKVETMCRLL